jgi:hypothetical protein
MSPKGITIPNLTDRECGDLAITAAEGGIGYWSRIDSYDYTRWSDVESGSRKSLPAGFVFYTIREDPDDDGSYKGKPIDITTTLLRRGYKLFIEQGRRLEDQGGPSYADATEADVVVQFGCFGEVVYG